MTQEEKAKVYDEALERASKLRFQNPFDTVSQMMEHIFPELKESEDERIRKWLIDTIKSVPNDSIEWDVIDKSDVLAWLEKQGDVNALIQEAAEKSYTEGMRVERKRWLEKQGDDGWGEGDVVRHGGILALVTNGRNAIKSNLEQITIKYPDEWVKAHTKERKYFFDELEKQGESKFYSWKPTKEQYEALDYAYNSCSDTERGNYYEGVLETLIEDLHRLEKQGQKPKWTEEDEKRLQSCIVELQGKGLMGGVDTIDTKWLKSLKQRMEEQQ